MRLTLILVIMIIVMAVVTAVMIVLKTAQTSTCALTPSLREAVGPLLLFLGGACPLLRVVARRQCLH